jgi:hypothetical protein
MFGSPARSTDRRIDRGVDAATHKDLAAGAVGGLNAGWAGTCCWVGVVPDPAVVTPVNHRGGLSRAGDGSSVRDRQR